MNKTGSAADGRTVCLILYAAIGALVLVYAAGAFLVGTSIAPDPAWGFLILDAMSAGAPFNHWVTPDPEDIARDISLFVAAWAPGQYLLPDAVQRLGTALGLDANLGQSCNVVVVLFSLLGLVGWHRLYRLWGFPPLSCALAVAVIAGTRQFAFPFGIYNGGEVLMFGALPWFIIVLWTCRDLRIWQALAVVLAIALLLAAKLTGLVFALAALAAIVLPDLWPPAAGKLRRPATALVIALAVWWLFHEFWMSRGSTAADTFGFHPDRLLTHSAAGLTVTLTSMLSLGDMAARLLFRDGDTTPLFPLLWLYVALSVPALVLLLFATRRLSGAYPDYLRFVLATSAIYVAFLTLVHVRGGAIDVEDRHYRPIGLMLLIGFVHVLVTLRGPAKVVGSGVVVASLAYGIASYAIRLEGNLDRPLSDRGYRHLALSRPLLDFIRTEPSLRADRSRSAVVVPFAEFSLALRGVRVIVIEGQTTQGGRVGRLMVLAPDRLPADLTTANMLDQFIDYDRSGWVAHPFDRFTYFVQ